MWLILREGFFSVGCGQDSDGKPDPGIKMIRGRCPHQLQKLINSYPDMLSGKRVVKTLETDYTYRILCNDWEFERLMTNISNSIDYSNFKQEVLWSNPADWQFTRFLHRVWEWWYITKGGFEPKPKKKQKGTPNGHNAKSQKKKNARQRRKAKPPFLDYEKGYGLNIIGDGDAQAQAKKEKKKKKKGKSGKQ